MDPLVAPVQYVKGVGPQRATSLGKLGIATAEDLLLHVPMRYEDRTRFARVADLRPGMRVSVSGRIAVAGVRRARRMTLYEVRLEDGSGRLLKALWFNQPFLKDVLRPGSRVVLFGLVEKDAYGSRQLVMRSPQYEVFDEGDAPGIHTGRMVPVYEKLGPLSGEGPAPRPLSPRSRFRTPSRTPPPRGAPAARRDRARRSPAPRYTSPLPRTTWTP